MADPLTILGTVVGTATVVGPAVAFFLKSKGKAAVTHADAERIDAQADATIAQALADSLKRAEERASEERVRAKAASEEAATYRTQAENERLAAAAAREETGHHRAAVANVRRSYDDRLTTLERLVVLQGAELEQCNDHRKSCDERLAIAEARLGLTPSRPMPAVKP